MIFSAILLIRPVLVAAAPRPNPPIIIHIVVVEKILKAVGKSVAPKITHDESINKPVAKLGITLKIQKILAVTSEAKTIMPACVSPCGVGITNVMTNPKAMPINPAIHLVCFIMLTYLSWQKRQG